MRRLTATLCLTLAVLLGSVGCQTVPNNGKGAHTDTFGNKYVGKYKDGKYHGQGTLTYANGVKYVGEFRDNKRHGQGTYTDSNGDKYVGEFRNGKGTDRVLITTSQIINLKGINTSAYSGMAKGTDRAPSLMPMAE